MRFRQFQNIWIKKSLHDLTKKINIKNKNKECKNVICNSAQLGLIRQIDFFDKEIAQDGSIENYTIIKKNDFVYNPRKSLNAPYGPVNIYNYEEAGIVSPLYLCFSVHDIDKIFLHYYFKSQAWYRFIYLNGDSGARHDRVSIKDEVFFSQNLYLPNAIEEEKIGVFLTLIDQRIDTQNKIIEDLDTLKNSIMDQLLMRDIFDEISIKDFINQGYARIIKASEMKKFSGEKLYLSTSSIDKNGIFKIECKITYNDRPSRASMIPIKNSVWFAKMKDSIKVYKSENDDESKYILSTGFYGILCNEDVVNPDWMVEIFKSNYFNNQKDRFSEGSSMSGIKENQLEDIKVKLFKNKNLEKKYCQLFYILNKKLNVETDYLEKLKEQKKYLLSNMFI